MLDEIEPWQLDEWIAYRTIEPAPETRLREIVKRGLLAIARGGMFGSDIKSSDLDPWEKKGAAKGTQPATEWSPENAAAMVRLVAPGARRTR